MMTGAILILLACVFALAGMSKLSKPDKFRATLRKLLPAFNVNLATIAIPLIELSLALFLVSGIAPKFAAACAVVLLLIFTAALLRMWHGGVRGCGCFGEASESAPSGVARNVLLIAGATYLVFTTDAVQIYSQDASILIGQLTLVLGVLSGWPIAVAAVQRRNLIFTQGATS